MVQWSPCPRLIHSSPPDSHFLSSLKFKDASVKDKYSSEAYHFYQPLSGILLRLPRNLKEQGLPGKGTRKRPIFW